MLDPDKVALAVLYYLHAVDDPDADGDAEGIARALGKGIATSRVVSGQLDRLFALGLVVGTGPLPIGLPGYQLSTPEWWGITHEGSAYVHSLLRQPRSFVRRLHEHGFWWLGTPEAETAGLTTKLTKVDVYDALHPPEPIPSAPETAVARTTSASDPIDWAKWGTIAAWIGIPIAVAGLVVSMIW